MKEVVGLYSGAITKPVDAMRKEVLKNPDEITSLLTALNSGTDILEEIDGGLNGPN